jgi:hypothetical protein
MNADEYNIKLKEMEAKMAAERQAIIEEFQQAQNDKERQKREAHEVLIDNAEFAAHTLVKLALGQSVTSDDKLPSPNTVYVAARTVYEYAILDTKQKDTDETQNLIDKLMAPPTSAERPVDADTDHSPSRRRRKS